MRYLNFLSFLIFLSFAISCSDNESIEKELNLIFPLLIENNNWKLSYYSEDGDDKTYLFNAYKFELDEDGVLKVLNQESMYIGTWKIFKKLMYELVFDFTGYENRNNKDFEFLNHSWEVYFRQQDLVKLQRTDDKSIHLYLKAD